LAHCGFNFLVMKFIGLSLPILQTATVATFEEVALKFVTVGEQVSFLFVVSQLSSVTHVVPHFIRCRIVYSFCFLSCC